MTMSSPTKMPSAKTVLSTAASVAASLMLARTIVHDFLPREVQDFFFSGFRNLINHFSSQQTIVIEEFDELTNNQVYEAAEIYLGNKISPSTQKLVRVSKSDKDKNIKVAMGRNEEIIDTFDGIQFKWRFVCTQVESNVLNHDPRQLNSTFRSEVRSLELNCHKKYKEKVLATYLPHILEQSKSMKEENKTVKLFTVGNMYNSLADMWNSINLDHPATFDTLAMDVELKRMVMEDLERFVQRKEFYRRVGKAWKRGYLLYGPPGTGKSSLIAAMANYLNFDIYDLELTDLRGNSDLRRLLIATANRSILVVEDIDCTVELQDRLAEARAAQPHVVYDEGQVTLSGLLNFTDGLWSSCGDERIIVFTTNHKDRLDHALLRPGRMDMHIHMSYCTPCGFNLLASNYLEINDHPRFREIEELIEKVEVTPAMVAEELMKKGNPEVALEGLLEFLQYKKRENEEAKITEIKEREPDQQESGDCSN